MKRPSQLIRNKIVKQTLSLIVMCVLGCQLQAQTNWPVSALAWQQLGYTNDGVYTIAPNGLGGQPVSVYCLMSVAGGGWTELTADVANSALNTNTNLFREYLYVQNGTTSYYRTPESSLVWSWSSGQDLYGTYYYSINSVESSFNITPSDEHQVYGVGGSSGGGSSYKCSITDQSCEDPANAQVDLCQDIPGIFGGGCICGVTVYIREAPQVPSFTMQPQNTIVFLDSPTNLAVMATGPAPLTYQWLFYGTNIIGATNSTLAFTSSQLTNAGVYSVVVGDSIGSVTSSNAILQVLPPGAPSIQANGVPAVGTMTFTNSVQVTILDGFPGGYIFYALDGSEPAFDSPFYTGAFTLTNSATVQAMSLSADFSDIGFAPPVNIWIVPIYNLQTAVVGSGTIALNPASGPYPSNSVVMVTAIPSANWVFDHWTGDASGNQNPLSVTMNGPRSVQAVFVSIPFYSLNTSVIGNGIISVDPPGDPYPSNSVVTVTATPSANWLFDHWTGDASGNQNPLSVTMNGPRSVQAVFMDTYPVTVSTPGGGSVTVNGQVPAPGTFYPAGSVLSLAATAGNGWSFLGWQGDASGANNSLSLTVNQTNNIQAIFGTVVNTNTLGGGVIVFNEPNPIPFGTILTASAVPNAGKYLVAWGGAASGVNNPTMITVTNANPAVSALFTTLPGGKYSLGVVVMGNGLVTISPQQNYYNPGDIVTLSATPSSKATIFDGWTGNAAGTNNPIMVVMNTNKIIQANFGVLPPAGVAIGFYPGLTISGVAGYSYVIQSSTNLADANLWVTLTNLPLTEPVQIWVDTSVDVKQPFNPLRFYRVLPGQ